MLVGLMWRGALALLLAVAWEGVRLLNGATWSWSTLGWRLALAASALLVGAWAATRRRRWLASVALVIPLCAAACWWDLQQPDTRVAWFGATGLFGTLLALESAFAAATLDRDSRLARLEYTLGLLLLSAFGGAVLTLLAQVESQFAEEEFFVAVQAIFLSLFSLGLLLAQVAARRFEPQPNPRSLKLRPLWGSLILLILGSGLAWWGGRAYQASFYGATAPGFEAVSRDAPFLCGSLDPAEGTPDGQEVFQRILKLVQANPHKEAPEYGMLALATGQRRWAEAFRRAIVAEAEAGRFTEPANSVKYGQRLAALRAYYLPRVKEAFPDLFSAREWATLQNWFAAINRRTLTVEWVDFLYGLAFSYWPQGPYENQENGAGLLALLESSGLGDDALSDANRDYLARHRRGWLERFRNTDDAYLYQTEWIDSALFQSAYQDPDAAPSTFERHRRLAFEWLLLQALPGGVPLTYNRPGAYSVATSLYLGARLSRDPRYVWAAQQAVDWLEKTGGYLSAQPGLEATADLAGAAPTQGSCLLFSPSGLPTQVGPLAPDKVVFRDGWTADATYLLLNLRFTGWHRYKGTNGVVMLYDGGPLVVEESTGEPFAWLPLGRSLFRDKRIPRENLNGLLIPRNGFSQVAFALSGLNGSWAQDPPHYARVEGFYRTPDLDASRTAIKDWRGWRHTRTVYFFHHGPVIIVDRARHAGGGQSALTWHLVGPLERAEGGFRLTEKDTLVRLASLEAGRETTSLQGPTEEQTQDGWDVTYRSPTSGQLDLVTTFLMNGWSGADYQVEQLQDGSGVGGQLIRLTRDHREIHLLHNETSNPISASGRSTDGLALIEWRSEPQRPHTVCTLEGTQASLTPTVEPRRIHRTDDPSPLRRGRDWEWEAGTLDFRSLSANSTCLNIEY